MGDTDVSGRVTGAMFFKSPADDVNKIPGTQGLRLEHVSVQKDGVRLSSTRTILIRFDPDGTGRAPALPKPGPYTNLVGFSAMLLEPLPVPVGSEVSRSTASICCEIAACE